MESGWWIQSIVDGSKSSVRVFPSPSGPTVNIKCSCSKQNQFRCVACRCDQTENVWWQSKRGHSSQHYIKCIGAWNRMFPKPSGFYSCNHLVKSSQTGAADAEEKTVGDCVNLHVPCSRVQSDASYWLAAETVLWPRDKSLCHWSCFGMKR